MEPKTPSTAFSVAAFLIGIALAIGASHCMEQSNNKPTNKCKYPETLEAICQRR